MADPVQQWLNAVLASPEAERIAHVETRPARETQFADLEAPIHSRLAERLDKLGLKRLYRHQAAAYDAAALGKDLIVVTGTASGKTLCYNLPVLQAVLTEPNARALYLFPTKALAQDQQGKLEELSPGPDVRCGTYDGDTPTHRRSAVRKLSHIVLTNPDMLHVGILPGHEQWTSFLKNLRYVVIDEMHTYRGIFGSHVAGVLRRLLRLCAWHRNRPQIIACSATIGNPENLFERLTGRQGHLIDEDGAPRAAKTFVFWSPPTNAEGEMRSPNVETARVVTSLLEANLRTLAFCRARITTELVLQTVRRHLKSTAVDPAAFESYRAGYTVKERREIEQALFQGKLMGLAATNAMELGVDIGGLDAVVMNGYPGTVSSFLQQSGRAGRGASPGLAIYVANDDPLEQFLLREPHRLLEGATESVALDPSNPTIVAQQLRCAAYERPIAPTEIEGFGPRALEVAEALDRAGDLALRGGLFYYPAHESPAAKVNIRGSGQDQVLLYEGGEALGAMERWRAMQYAHAGAVYLHRGVSYVVDSLDLDAGRAEVHREDTDYYTQPLVQSSIETTVDIASDGRFAVGGVHVTDLVLGYRKRAHEGGATLGVYDLEVPPQTFDTIAVRLDLPPFDPDEEMETQMAAVHGLEHALLAIAPLLAGCDRGDLGSGWYAYNPDVGGPSVTVFDRAPGGVGLSEALFRQTDAWLSAAEQLLAGCKCEDGCPGCLLSARCEAGNALLSKAATLRLIRRIR